MIEDNSGNTTQLNPPLKILFINLLSQLK